MNLSITLRVLGSSQAMKLLDYFSSSYVSLIGHIPCNLVPIVLPFYPVIQQRSCLK